VVIVIYIEGNWRFSTVISNVSAVVEPSSLFPINSNVFDFLPLLDNGVAWIFYDISGNRYKNPFGTCDMIRNEIYEFGMRGVLAVTTTI